MKFIPLLNFVINDKYDETLHRISSCARKQFRALKNLLKSQTGFDSNKFNA